MTPSKKPLVVTDHAVLRYLERAVGLNVEMVREHILGLCATPAAFGVRAVKAEGVRFEIANSHVVTVTPDEGNYSRTRKMVLSVAEERTEGSHA